ncbi:MULTISPECIES: putative ABC transporter permease subunit [Bacillus cereus group]|uniref:ABC transporter permease n=1 Tax=Bacillus toyonensis TaxID=155322 RepID=A0AB73QSZ4_9BACI|nr:MULTISPECIES: ABC transporter permease [Bacillus cereus group]MBJ7929401.1 ABC transporter permease [Bacillus cereus group sp. N31]PEG15474.1 ABC transporter permease [Bacillus toyonensis]PEI82053.1 ABC transporter permease [Bacillus toyonensis]PEK06589.1 ABC transporter permease [Bacillus toyonensis]PEP77710.1 ABC transporter permease [Bacillus toyonensis]
MSKIWTLTKVLLKLNYADFITDKKKRWAYVFSFAAILFVGFLIFGSMTHGMYEGMKQLGQDPGMIIAMGLAIASIWVFLMSITNILTVFYYSNDIEMLLPLPLKPAQIISAKFLTVLITQYVMSSFILLPIFITYGLKSDAFITYYIYMIFIYLLFPIVPLVLASLLMTVIMRYTNIAKNKDRGNIFIGIVSILFIVGINVFMQWRNKSAFSGDGAAEYLVNNQSSLIVQMTNYFPTTYFGAVALVESANWKGPLYVMIFALISFVFFVLFYYIAERTYLKGVIGLSTSTAKKEVISAEGLQKSTVQSSHLKAYVKKEFKTLFRTPQFFLNCIVQTFVMPIMLFFILFVQDGNLKFITEYINNPETTGFAIGVGLCASLFLMGSNVIATTSFSRDGSSWFVNRYLPVKASDIFFAKAITAWLINVIILAVFGITMAVVAGISPVFMILWFLLSANGLLLINLIGTRWDAQTADIHWDTEQKLFKSRYTTLWNFLANILIALIIVAGVSVLYFFLQVGLWVMFIVLFAMFTIVNYIFIKILKLGAERILSNIN